MNSRERVEPRGIKFRTPGPGAHLPRGAAGRAAQVRRGARRDPRPSSARISAGTTWTTCPLEKFPALYKQGRNADDFGTVWYGEWLGICGIPVEWPIADLSRYDEYRWPEDFTAGPPSGRQYSGHMCGFDDRWYARGAWITYFEQLQQLRGMENLLMDIAAPTRGARTADGRHAGLQPALDRQVDEHGVRRPALRRRLGRADPADDPARHLAPALQAALRRDVQAGPRRRHGRLVPQRRPHQRHLRRPDRDRRGRDQQPGEGRRPGLGRGRTCAARSPSAPTSTGSTSCPSARPLR